MDNGQWTGNKQFKWMMMNSTLCQYNKQQTKTIYIVLRAANDTQFGSGVVVAATRT